VQHKVDRAESDLSPFGVLGLGPGRAQVGARQQGLVAQHLFEVGDVPLGVHAVTREAPSEVVVDPSSRHGVQGPLDRAACRFVLELQQRLDVTGSRELWGVPESSFEVHSSDQFVAKFASCSREVEYVRERRKVINETDFAIEGTREFIGLVLDRVAPGGPGVVHRRQECGETRLAVTLDGGIVRAGHEGPSVRDQEHRHRPSTVSTDQLRGRHVDRVDVGPLLTVDLDGNEVLIE